jgi:hypothetical protein
MMTVSDHAGIQLFPAPSDIRLQVDPPVSAPETLAEVFQSVAGKQSGSRDVRFLTPVAKVMIGTGHFLEGLRPDGAGL